MGPVRRFVYHAVPAFALFGPVLVVNAIPWTNGVGRVMALAGALMTGLSIAAVWRRQRDLAARLEARDGAPGLEAP